MTEKMLNQAFDLQRFTPNERLQSVIDDSHARMSARELSDAELEFVAGGVQTRNTKLEEPPK